MWVSVLTSSQGDNEPETHQLRTGKPPAAHPPTLTSRLQHNTAEACSGKACSSHSTQGTKKKMEDAGVPLPSSGHQPSNLTSSC